MRSEEWSERSEGGGRVRGAHLSEVPAVQSHAVGPEVLEEVWQYLLLDVVWLHTVRHATLLDHLGEGEGGRGRGRGRGREGEGEV